MVVLLFKMVPAERVKQNEVERDIRQYLKLMWGLDRTQITFLHLPHLIIVQIKFMFSAKQIKPFLSTQLTLLPR